MTSSTLDRRPDTASRPADAETGRRAFSTLTGVSALAVLLQGLWAGLFLEHPSRMDEAGGWVDVHARGGEVALLFAVLALGWAVLKLRSRRDLLLGAGLLTALLVVESYLGGLIRDESKATLTAVHVPLGMAIMAVAVWLPLRARRHP